MKKNCAVVIFFTILFAFFAFYDKSEAKTDLSITETDITFSKADPLNGDLIRVYARVFNAGDTDVSGRVVFLSDGAQMSDPQAISLKPSTYDDVFVDWKVKAGTYNVEAKIVGLIPQDDDIENNKTVKKSFFVDYDTDGDGIGDSKDLDDDNDDLNDEEEKIKGTDPLLADTDGDKVNDKIDEFPLDKTEWRDTDKDSVGDNKDPDADGDGLNNEDETQKYGTNPLNADSDNDGFLDQKEIEGNTNPNQVNKTSMSPADFTAGLLNSKNSIYLIFGGPFALLVLLLLFHRKKSKK